MTFAAPGSKMRCSVRLAQVDPERALFGSGNDELSHLEVKDHQCQQLGSTAARPKFVPYPVHKKGTPE